MSNSKMLSIYLKKYLLAILAVIVLAAISVVCTLLVPIQVGNSIDYMIGINKVDFSAISLAVSRIIVLVVVTGVSQYILSIINNYICYHITLDIRNDAIKKIEVLPLSYLDSHKTGETVSKIIADTDTLADGLLMGFTQLFTGLTTIFGTLIFMLSKSVTITFVVIVLTPLSLFVARYIATNIYNLFLEQSKLRSKQTGIIDEMIGNQKIVQAFNYQDKSLELFDETNEKLVEKSLKATFFSSLTNPATRFVNNVVYAAVGLLGAFNVIKGGMSIGNLSIFLSYANQYTKPFNEISGVIAELQNAFACASRVFELINQPAEPVKQYDKHLTDVKGNIDIENVNFSYVADKKLIENFNLHVTSGQKVAIVGPTGCGKTTLINLLMRFYDVNSGCIKVDGIESTDISREELRSNFGMVLQDTWLKEGTIRDNLLMANPSASEEKMIEAAKKCYAHSFIRRLEKGYDTIINENDDNLSNGQRQLLCIARVMLANPKILILDEATSSIDTRTEIEVQKAFDKLMQGKTSFVVAHRLSTIKGADVILVMNDGHIIETGNHESLLAQKGFYYNLYNSQFAK